MTVGWSWNLLTNLVVAAGEVEQRVAIRHFGADHATDEDIVVARDETVVDAALDMGDGAGQQGHPGLAGFPDRAVKTVVALAREALGNVALRRRQHVDSK